MPGSSSWMPYAPHGIKGLDDYDDDDEAVQFDEYITKQQCHTVCRSSVSCVSTSCATSPISKFWWF